MLIVENNSTNPYFNVASEEYLLKNIHNDCFMLWRSNPSILVGKHQNTLSEINMEYIKNNKIPVIRRLSGGGTVFNDLGNINFTFIVKNKDNFYDFKYFANPIIEVLNNIGINAYFSGRNDMVINEKKFSGNAQYKYKNKILHHGTLLFNSNMNALSAAIKSRPEKFKGKSIKSVSSRVTNISEHLKTSISILDFKKLIVNYIFNKYPNVNTYHFNEQDKKDIKNLVKNKYSTWEYNFGNSPKYSFNTEIKYPSGLVQACFNVKNGTMKNVRFYGDFFSREDVCVIENSLEGIPHSEESIRKKLSIFKLENYFHNLNIDNIIKLFFD
ncbi:MAG: lipoate--protein ligase [Firmicutes bacterium]|nr:lipoate--protein ligase [Bacillota bacterium]